MAHIDVRLGKGGDVDDAASVYEPSNLVRRKGNWSSRPGRIAQVTANLYDAAGHDTGSWFLIGRDGGEAVAMALIHPFRADDGSGDVIAGTWFLSLIYVVPERWGIGRRRAFGRSTATGSSCTTRSRCLSISRAAERCLVSSPDPF